jgi:hypothetical protein
MNIYAIILMVWFVLHFLVCTFRVIQKDNEVKRFLSLLWVINVHILLVGCVYMAATT